MDGAELLVTAAEDTLGWGLYPMVPFAGRVRDGVLMFRGLQYELPLRYRRMHCTAPFLMLSGLLLNNHPQK